ncbi:MAG TPA: NlpC/P60 family protein [Dermatophilaceae bacterium]|nr:NlpC/P60 family protein [Dermatophilaceae bacterium]
MAGTTAQVSRVRRRRYAALVAGGVVISTLVALPGGSALAEPVYPSAKQVADAKTAAANKAGQVAAIQGQLAAASARLAQVQRDAEVAAEAYNLARAELEVATRAADAAAKRAAAAAAKAGVAADKVGLLAAQAYTSGGSLGGLEAFLSSNGPQDVIDRVQALTLVGDIRQRVLQDASAASIVAGVLQRQAAAAKAQQLAAEQKAKAARAAAQAKADAAAAETIRIQQQQAALIVQLAALQQTSVRLEQQRQAGLRAEAERRARAAAKAAAEARARAQARAEARRQAAAEAERRRREQAHHTSSPPSPPSTPTPPSDPSPRGGVGAVIAFARAQLGEWYLWGGAGPDRWDCSGLTMMAWRQAGVYLSHYTGWQWQETRHVPLSQRRPGDLVFYGSPIHHMGLYIGNDTMIEAPHTGAQVRYANIWRSDILPDVGRP